MVAEIIKNMYEMSLAEFAVMIVDTLTYLVALFIVLVAFGKLDKVTKSKHAKGVKLSILATILSSFVARSIVESSEEHGLIEVFVFLIPSIFTLLAAVCFYRFTKEVLVKYS